MDYSTLKQGDKIEVVGTRVSRYASSSESLREVRHRLEVVEVCATERGTYVIVRKGKIAGRLQGSRLRLGRATYEVSNEA